MNIRIKVNNETESRVIQEFLYSIGCKWSSGSKIVENVGKECYLPSIIYAKPTGIYGWDSLKNSDYLDWKLYDITQLAEIEKALKEEVIKVGEYSVEFKSDGIKVGCQFVDKETVKKIYNKLFNN